MKIYVLAIRDSQPFSLGDDVYVAVDGLDLERVRAYIAESERLRDLVGKMREGLAECRAALADRDHEAGPHINALLSEAAAFGKPRQRVATGQGQQGAE